MVHARPPPGNLRNAGMCDLAAEWIPNGKRLRAASLRFGCDELGFAGGVDVWCRSTLSASSWHQFSRSRPTG